MAHPMSEQSESQPTPASQSLSRKLLPLLLFGLLTVSLSFGIVRRTGMDNISPCTINFVCSDGIDRQRGDYRKVQYGFPLTYRATEGFTRKPNGDTTYGTALREFQPFNPAFAALNLLFWGTLLLYAWRLIGRLSTKKDR